MWVVDGKNKILLLDDEDKFWLDDSKHEPEDLMGMLTLGVNILKVGSDVAKLIGG